MTALVILAIVATYVLVQFMLRTERKLGRLDERIAHSEERLAIARQKAAYLESLTALADKRGGVEYVTAGEFLDLWEKYMADSP